MKLVTAEEMRGLDRRTIEGGIPGETLMGTAGAGLADAIRKTVSEHQLVDTTVLFIAGTGNNGGDAFVAAEVLHEEGVELFLESLHLQGLLEERLHGDREELGLVRGAVLA